VGVSLAALAAARSPGWSSNGSRVLRAGVLIATFRRDAPRALPRVCRAFAAGVAVWHVGGRYDTPGWSPDGYRPLHTGALIATFRRAAPARYGALVDERCIVAGDEGGRVRPIEPARPWPRRSPWAFRCGTLAGATVEGFWAMGSDVRASAGRVAADGPRFPRSIRFVRLELK
jgi:hypothetical protein